MAQVMRERRPAVHYAWVMVGITFLTLVTSAGMRSMPGVLMVPLERDFGWSRAAISLSVSINLLLFGLMGPFAAALMERFGLRRVMLAALSCAAGAVLLTTGMRSVWQLDLLWGVVVGGAAGSMGTILGATVANRWFAARRGLVVGLLSASSATGQLVFLPLLAWLIVHLGWRSAALLVGGVMLGLIPLVALIVRNRPADIGLRPYGAGPTAAEAPLSQTNPFRNALLTLNRAVRVRDFWFLAGSFFICGASTNGLIGTHLIPASMEHGIAEVTAASLLAAMGVFDLVGTSLSGWLSDRFDNRLLLAWYYGLRGLSLVFLPFAYNVPLIGLGLFAVFYGLDWLATVPPTVRLSADIFGPRRGTIVFGWVFTAHQLGAAVAASGAGILHTWLGDYQLAFISAGILCLLATGLVLQIRQAPRSAQPPALEPVAPAA